MKVKIKILDEKAQIPKKAHVSDAGFDLTATSFHYDEYGCSVYGTGLAFEIPQGYVGLIFPRSSNAKKDLILTNCVGVIDSGYRGEVMFKFKPLMYWGGLNHKPTARHEMGNYLYEIGDRIGQLIIMPIPEIEFCEVSELTDSDRGNNGYGSTGK